MRPFQFFNEQPLIMETTADVVNGFIDGRRLSLNFYWGGQSTNTDSFDLIRFNGTLLDFITHYNELSGTSNDCFYFPTEPIIDLILLKYGDDAGVLSFTYNDDHETLPLFHNWQLAIDYRVFYFRGQQSNQNYN